MGEEGPECLEPFGRRHHYSSRKRVAESFPWQSGKSEVDEERSAPGVMPSRPTNATMLSRESMPPLGSFTPPNDAGRLRNPARQDQTQPHCSRLWSLWGSVCL